MTKLPNPMIRELGKLGVIESIDLLLAQLQREGKRDAKQLLEDYRRLERDSSERR